MFTYRSFLFPFLVSFFAISSLNAQISISTPNGCLPGGITNAVFTYVGSGTASNITWNFGDGSPTTNLNPTQHSYPSVGSYTVTFSATVGGSSVTYTALVTVNPQPTGAFTTTVPSTHCSPMTVNFSGSSPLTTAIYKWDFGDGNIITGNPTNHTYNTSGSFIPILTVQNTLTGCFANISGNAINVSIPPNIAVNFNPGITSCSSSLTVAFTASNSSSGSPSGGGLTFNWNFGSFGTSAATTPNAITFQPQGIYPVTLTVTDNNSCSSTSIIPVSLISPTVNATVPATVCIGNQDPNGAFTATVESNQVSTQWSMGDGNTVIFPIPLPSPSVTPILIPNVPYSSAIHSYNTAGIKTITITATSGACVATITRTIMVEAITPLFVSPPPSFMCSSPYNLSLVNQSTVNTNSSLSYTWTVDHENKLPASAYTSTAVNPTITVTQGLLANPFRIDSTYRIKVNLKVVSQPLGCKAAINLTLDSLRRPTAWFTKDKSEGCAPLTVTYKDSSFTDKATFPITSYTWNNGASPPTIVSGTGSSFTTQVFTYASPGTYTPFLTVQTSNGCTDVSFIDTVRVANPPTISYTLPLSPICVGQPVTVTLSAASTETVQHWHVASDNGYFSGCVNDRMPTWAFTHPGVHGFTISAYQFGCEFTGIPSQMITVNGPICKGRFETKCTGNKKDVKFYYDVSDATNATLDFGDGSGLFSIAGVVGSVVSGNTNHIYTATGDYVATLKSYGSSGCFPWTHTMLVTVREIAANFQIVDDVICLDGNISLNALASVDVFTTCSRGYTWFFDDAKTIQTPTVNPSINLPSFPIGLHNVTLSVKDINGCTDQMSKSFRVSSPIPDFTFNKNPVCISDMPMQVIDQTSQAIDPVSNYSVVMGDGAVQFSTVHTTLTSNTSGYSPFFTYNLGNFQTFNFTVSLWVKNSEGCVAGITHTLTVNNPKINMGSFNVAVCENQPSIFYIVAANTHTNYHINFGDSVAFNKTNYTNTGTYYYRHVYTQAGTYTPQITLTDNGGCSVSASLQPILVEPYPASSFTLCNFIDGTSGSDFCMPFTSSLTSTSQYSFPLTYYWDLGKGDPTTITSSSVAGTTFTNTGSYTASLTVITPYAGCATKSSLTFQIYDPHINFLVVPDSVKLNYCLGQPITVSVTSSSGANYFIWDFGDGVVRPKVYLPTIPSLLSAVYTNTYFPELTNGELTIEATGYAGTVCKDVKRKKINVIRVLGDFKRNNELNLIDYQHCLGKQDIFEGKSVSNSTGSIAYGWNFGDGATDVITLPAHTYTLPGIYTVGLTSTESLANCTAATSKTILVLPLPTASLNVTPASCPDIPFKVEGAGTPGVAGSITGTLLPTSTTGVIVFDSSNTFTTIATASVSTTYSLNVTDENGCVGSAANGSVYIPKPVPVIHWDTTVIIGQPIPLNAYLGLGYTYTWSPLVTDLNCDTCLFYNPVSTSTNDITYTVQVEDSMSCSMAESSYRIKINPVVSLDVPTAFTPNGDGINDFIFPDGWGLKKLIYFKIFNRWGQLLFESNDMKIGWNGTFQGVLQNMETYVYQVSVETFLASEPVLSKTGTFKLLR